MPDRPILFSGPMVRAILDGRKTQTRRVLMPQPNRMNGGLPLNDGHGSYSCEGGWKRLPFARNDRLWVREHWRTASAYEDLSPSQMGGEEPVIFEADGAVVTHGWPSPREVGRHRQGMHMPRWASRLTLTVTDVRVQRLQDISEDDAVSEGLLRLKSGRYVVSQGDQYAGVCSHRPSLIFGAFWDHLNAKRGFGWDANPWVCAVTFTAHQHNIDLMEAA